MTNGYSNSTRIGLTEFVARTDARTLIRLGEFLADDDATRILRWMKDDPQIADVVTRLALLAMHEATARCFDAEAEKTGA